MDNKWIGDFLLEKRADWILWKENQPMASLWGEYGKGRLDLLEPYFHP